MVNTIDGALSIAGEPGMSNNAINRRLIKAPTAEAYLSNPLEFLNPM